MAFLVTQGTAPEFRQHGAGLHIHLFLVQHDYTGGNTKPEKAAGAGENVIHGEGMQGWDKNFRHRSRLHELLHFIQELTKKGQGLVDRRGGGHVYAGALQQVDGALAAAAGEEA